MKPRDKVFLLEHVHTFEDAGESTKTIGVYSSEEAAKQSIERLKSQPGFCEAPDGFTIDRYVLDEDSWAEGYFSGASQELT